MNYKVRLLKYGKMSVETKVALTNTLALFQSKVSLKDEKENEINELLAEVLKYMRENYPNEGIIDVEYYAEHDGMISTRIVSAASIYIGAEIERATRTVHLYNFEQRNIETFVLPE